MKDFFLYKTELSTDIGFELFGVCHWLWMIGIGIFSWWMGRFFSFAEKTKVMRVRKVLGVIFLYMDLSRMIVLIVNDHFVPAEYPLHLCNMSLWIGAIYLWTKNRFAGVVYVLLCLPAAALTAMFPGWLRYPFWNYMHIHNFLYHGLVVALGWSLVRSKELIPKWKDLWMPFVFGVSGYVIMSWLNRRLDTNYWFINTPSYSSPLGVIYELLGDKGYLLGHFLLCCSVVILWMGILHRYSRANKKPT